LVLKPQNKTNLKLLLAFSGSFTFFDDAPASDVYESKDSNIGIFIMMGIFISNYIGIFSPKGQNGRTRTSKHDHIPWLLFISLCIHAFLKDSWHHHDNLAIGIAIHHLPIAII
jgi:hypothetical protein